MKSILLITIILFSNYIIVAQTDTLGVSKYNIGVGIRGLEKVNRVVRGEIYMVTDSGIVLKIKVKGKPVFELLPVPLNKIDYITVKKKGSGGRGFLTGALTGLFLGGLLGFADGSDANANSNSLDGIFSYTAEEKALMGGVTGLVAGGIIGVAIGNMKKVIKIEGKSENYNKYNKMIKSYSIR